MTLRVVRLGSPRVTGEGLRIGTVRRPPRGIPKSEFASGNWYDVWLPLLAPSEATRKMGRAAEDDASWRRFARRYRTEMTRPEAKQTIALLAALSHVADFSVGCYCKDESLCHRSLLRELFIAGGAHVR